MAVGLGLLAQPAIAQQAPPDAPAIQRVEITASAIKRADSETALPITVTTHADLERTAATTAQDLVNLIPSNFGGGVLAQNIGSTGNPSTANLRGLGSQYTLVLLNGRRVANYAFGNSPVDLNSIPLSAIERIEVLRDGASAYGADAVAGVINFILRKDYQGAEISAYDSKVQRGGGDSKSFNLTTGFGDIATQRFNVLLSANHETDDALTALQRDFASTGVRPDPGLIKNAPRNGIPNARRQSEPVAGKIEAVLAGHGVLADEQLQRLARLLEHQDRQRNRANLRNRRAEQPDRECGQFLARQSGHAAA